MSAPVFLTVPAQHDGLRADVFLSSELPFLSRTRIRQKIQMGESFLNGRRFSTATRLRTGDRISIVWRGQPERGPVAEMEILYEDDTLLAVNKPAGAASHPMGRRQTGTVVQFARARFAARIRESLAGGDMTFYPTLVNRLDVLTSGIVIVALTQTVHKAMQALAGARLIAREYLALVDGEMDDVRGVVDFAIGPDEASAVGLKMACRADGKESETRYEVIERFPGHTLLRVTPITGRQHQVRVHLAAIGHPVTGDLLYKDESLFLAARAADASHGTPPGGLPSRHFLHARCARFAHPVTGAQVRMEAPVPSDFQTVLVHLRQPRV